MKTLGLVGKTLGYSFSKKHFEEKFSVQKLSEYRYLNFEIEAIANFPDIFKDKSIIGLSCTIPYKQEVIKYLNELSDEAKAIGAVNTIKVSRVENELYLKGYNTDCFGFEKSLITQLETYHNKAIILGTGGASLAVEYVLKKLEIPYLIVSRSASTKEGVVTYNELNESIIKEHKLIINCTPLGTYPDVDACANIPYQYIGDKHYLYDLVYNPECSLFLSKGKEKGASIKNGLEMLQLQADKAWEIWNE